MLAILQLSQRFGHLFDILKDLFTRAQQLIALLGIQMPSHSQIRQLWRTCSNIIIFIAIILNFLSRWVHMRVLEF